jgi:hypothetical protein
LLEKEMAVRTIYCWDGLDMLGMKAVADVL